MSGIDGITSPPSWMRQALCAETDPEIFFPEKGGSTAQAKAVCRACPVSTECLDHALALENEAVVNRFGVWGGLSERERRKLTKGDGTQINEQRFTERQISDMCRRYEAGVSVDRIAASFGVSHPTIARRLRAAGMVLRSPGAQAGEAS